MNIDYQTAAYRMAGTRAEACRAESHSIHYLENPTDSDRLAADDLWQEMWAWLRTGHTIMLAS